MVLVAQNVHFQRAAVSLGWQAVLCPEWGRAEPSAPSLCWRVGWRMDPASREELGMREETLSPALPL